MPTKKKKIDLVETDEKVVADDTLESQKETAKHLKEAGSKEQTILTEIEDYIKTSSYLGTKVITPSMRKYVYRRRMDGLAILNTLIVDKKLKETIGLIVQYKPEDWILVCKRESGWRAVKMFSELTGVRVFTKKYPAGIITNINLPDFFETKMVMICDPWLDKNALNDAKIVRIPVVGICNTNNNTFDIDAVVIGNNHSNKSLGLFFWLIAREYMKAYRINKKLPSLEDFVGEELVLEEPKKKRKEKEESEKLKEAEQAIEEKFKQIAESEGGGAEEGV
jgi:ribosomal protein uS2